MPALLPAGESPPPEDEHARRSGEGREAGTGRRDVGTGPYCGRHEEPVPAAERKRTAGSAGTRAAQRPQSRPTSGHVKPVPPNRKGVRETAKARNARTVNGFAFLFPAPVPFLPANIGFAFGAHGRQNRILAQLKRSKMVLNCRGISRPSSRSSLADSVGCPSG